MTSSAVRLMPATLSKELKHFEMCRFCQRLVWVGRETTCCSSRCLQHWLQLWQPGRCEDAGPRLAPGGPPLLQADGGALPQPQHTLDSWQPSLPLHAQPCCFYHSTAGLIIQINIDHARWCTQCCFACWMVSGLVLPRQTLGIEWGQHLRLDRSARQASLEAACSMAECCFFLNWFPCMDKLQMHNDQTTCMSFVVLLYTLSEAM